MRQIVIIAHDIRSAHNVGALLRTADGFGAQVCLTGYTPFPSAPNDNRLPHLASKLTRQIHKTALGAETDHSLWSHYDNLTDCLGELRDKDFEIIGLEQAKGSIALPEYAPPEKVAILLGREVEGIDPSYLKDCDKIVEIPMLGHKESFNVVESAAATLYHCRFVPY